MIVGDKEMERIADFLIALSEAQDEEKKEFSCPICGGKVKMVRAPGNGHIHAACDGCGTKVCE